MGTNAKGNEPARRPSRVVTAVVVLVLAVCGLALLGFVVRVKALVALSDSAQSMRPWVATMLIIGAVGLWLVAPEEAGRTRRRCGQAVGAVVALFGAFVLVEYGLGWHAGIDDLLFRERVLAGSLSDFPGRPSPHTAVALVGVGLAVALLDVDRRRGFRPAAILAPAGALVTCVALLGQAYGLVYLSGESVVNQMSYNSAVCFIALSAGLLACRPDRTAARVFLGSGAGGTAVRQLAMAAVVLLVLTGVLLIAVGRLDLGHKSTVVTVTTAVMVLTLYMVFLRAGAHLDRADRVQRDLLDELRTERDFNRTVLQSLREGVLIADPAGRVLDVNPRWCEITGYSTREAVGRTPPYPWLSAEEVPDRADPVPPTDAERDVFVRRPDGQQVAVELTTTQVRDEDGLRLAVTSYRDLTARNLAEAERRRAAEQLDHFFRISSDLLCIAGDDGYFKHLNPAWEHALGYSVEELMSRPYLDFVHPDDVAKTKAEVVRQSSEGTQTVAFENRYRCRDGSYRWLNWSAVPIPEEEQTYAVARDTTRQRDADEARAQLAAIVNGTDDAVIGQTLDGVITSWNPAAERQFGYAADEVIGRSIRLIVPAGQACELDELHHIRRNKPVRLHNTVRRRKDGTEVRVEVSVSPIRDSAGNVVGAASIARDITDRIKAEQRFRQLVLAAPDAMVIVDDRGTIVLVNEQTERLFGYQGAELIGRPVEVLVPPGVRDQHSAHRQSYLVDPRYRRMGSGLELSGVRQDGSEFPVEISLSPLETEQGMLVSAAIRDISERREVERALADARDNALAAAQLKSQFVAMVSHEIRTPMNGVIGLTGLLLETPLEPAQRRYAESIEVSARALLTIINDILDFSKIEAGKLRLIDSDFQLDYILEEVVQAVAEAARKKHLEIVCDYPPGLPTGLRGDDGRLRQALLNLVGNAVKFTEQGNVVLRAEPTGTGADGRQRITFTVVDTGIGIAQENLARLFEPFSQADAHSTRKYGGTGLGLTITGQLVELMGGRLEAASELGCGSQFWFTLEFTPQARPPERPAHLALRDCMNGNHLLVVDDNPTSLRLIARHATAWGMNPTTVLDGHTALKRLREAGHQARPFRIAIIDQHMPGFGGVELTRAIGANPEIPSLKIILLTSGSYEDDQNAENAGATAVLPKPIGPSQLYNCLLELLKPEGVQPRARKPAPPTDSAAGPHGVVLLAEDNEINQMVAVDILSMLGYQVDVARDGIEVLELVGTKPYQAILMDCQMPRMDGYTATAELRKREQGDQHIPIIAMTAHALAEDRQRCLAAGMDDYLSKPIDPEKLRHTLDQWTRSTSDDPRPSLP